MNSLLLLSLLSLLLLAAAATATAVHPAKAAAAAAQTVRRTTARTVQQRPRAPAAKAALGTAAIGPEPNPPVWPASVSVFTPSDPAAKINAVVNNAFKLNGGHEPPNHGQFSPHRFAFMFAPGTYGADVEVPVGYYTQVLGLGASPLDTVFTSPLGVFCQETDFALSGALDTFWRGAENFRHAGDHKWYVGKGMMWAASQASPIRRLAIDNDLLLFEYEPPIPEAGEASGGYFANLEVSGNVTFGSQQQFFARDSTVKGTKGGAWSIVTTGVKGAPPSQCQNKTNPYLVTSVEATPVIADKPFITISRNGTFALNVPHLRNNSAGHNWDTPKTVIPFENVYVTQPGDSAELMNTKLSMGLHLVVTPGIYMLDEPLIVPFANQVILGLGLATLVSAKQNTLIRVADVDGVRVAGLLLQAGKPARFTNAKAPYLLEWGSIKQRGKGENPGVMSDVFARVGGPDGFASSPVAVDTMVIIRRGHVIIDHTWLWRADHTAGADPTFATNPAYHGLIVEGDDVTAYGLAVEHAERDMVIWIGERGRTYFGQFELPYDATQKEFGDRGYVAYRVDGSVLAHQANGVGVYCYFRDEKVSVRSGIIVPQGLVKSFTNPFSVFLNGNGPGIMHVINNEGYPVTKAGQVNYICPSEN